MSKMSKTERERGMAQLCRGFMAPNVFYAAAGKMVEVETPDDGTIIGEAAYAEDAEATPLAAGWYAELSAPGYLDRTGYAGPFPSEEAAEEYLVETFADAEEDAE